MLTIFALVLFAACGPNPDTVVADRSPLLVEVVDGDTIVVSFPTGDVEPVRLLGIDTPETVDPTRPVQCFGREASTALESLLPPGAALRLERDVEARDRFGRLLAYVYRAEDNLFVNRALLHDGFADVAIYEPNEAYRSELTAAVTSARTRAAGLWEVCGGPDVPLNPDGSERLH